MAVRHGYGKIAGADALVFAYDTGDTRNSYKGEPTTNLWDSMLNTQSLRTHTKHYWDGKKWTEDATYSHPGVEGPRGTYLGVVFKHISGALNSSWSGTSYGYMLRDIACTNGATMTMSSWIYASTDCDVDAIPAVIEGESGGESSVAGYPSTYDLTNKGSWQQTAKKATSDGNTRFIPLYPRKGGVTDGSFAGFFMWALPQVTYGDHVVQPIQPGTTRSATEGLKDLTGNYSINLANTGFDSNAQPVFDGTNDHMDVGTGILSGTGDFTVEAVVQSDYQEVNGTIFANYPAGNFQTFFSGRFIGLFLANSSTYLGTAPFTVVLPEYTTDPIHFVAQREGTTTRLYLNGVLKKTGSSSSTIGSTSTAFRVGANTSGTEDFLGDIFVVKAYNRALTAAEVKNNYNNYKGRFGI